MHIYIYKHNTNMYPKSTPQSRTSKKMEVMSSLVEHQDLKAKAEVYYGNQTCRERFTVLLTEIIGLPNGLLTVLLQDIEECGYVKEVGFVWLKYVHQRQHRFDNILVYYDTVVTAYLEPNKIKNLTGIKAKDFLFWISLTEIYVDPLCSSGSASITFKTPIGLSRSFPVSMFDF